MYCFNDFKILVHEVIYLFFFPSVFSILSFLLYAFLSLSFIPCLFLTVGGV
jgi:hypothetical protein